jgi:hypothetical protein
LFNVLAITLYSGEAEFEDCVSAINQQKNCKIDHKIYSNLSEIDAHNVLLEKFENEKQNYDLFVKVDADTVIKHDYAFDIVFQKLSSTGAAAAQLYLYDYFTCKNINGLNFYNPKLNHFKKTSDKLFPDRSIVHLGRVLYSDNFIDAGIIPVGMHCAYPNDKQSFHYGFHRGLKKRDEQYQSTLASFKRYQDNARAIACGGFEFSKKFPNFSHDYSSEEFNKIFLQFLDGFNNAQ